MKRTTGVLLFVAISALFAVESDACEQCQSYFYYGCSCWCKYCAAAYCGDFNCEIRQQYGVEWCSGEEGCFTTGRGCMQEPPVAVIKLEDTWRLSKVRILPPPPVERLAKRRDIGP